MPMTSVRVVRSWTTSPRRYRGIAAEPTGAGSGASEGCGDQAGEREEADHAPAVDRHRVIGRGGRDELDPAQERVRRELEDPGDAGPGPPADRSRDESPDRERADDGRREQVRGQRDERDGAEDREQDREDAELRGRGDAERLRERARAGDAGGDAPAQGDDPRRRAARQQEADRVDEERVDDEEADRGKGE